MTGLVSRDAAQPQEQPIRASARSWREPPGRPLKAGARQATLWRFRLASHRGASIR
jgi:hypothetical protein